MKKKIKVFMTRVDRVREITALFSYDFHACLFFVYVPDLLSEIRREENWIPGKAELEEALRDLEKSSGIDPEGYRFLSS